jgi:hypothetical protein
VYLSFVIGGRVSYLPKLFEFRTRGKRDSPSTATKLSVLHNVRTVLFYSSYVVARLKRDREIENYDSQCTVLQPEPFWTRDYSRWFKIFEQRYDVIILIMNPKCWLLHTHLPSGNASMVLLLDG